MCHVNRDGIAMHNNYLDKPIMLGKWKERKKKRTVRQVELITVVIGRLEGPDLG